MKLKLITLSTILFLSACQQPQPLQQPDPARQNFPPSVDLTSNNQIPTRDIFERPIEVTRVDRYVLVNIDPTEAQRDPLQQLVEIKIPSSKRATVADGMRLALNRTGFTLCAANFANSTLYSQPLPTIHHDMGPMRVSDALQVMAGEAWQLEIDRVQRVVCHSVRSGFQSPRQNNRFFENTSSVSKSL